MLYAIFINPAIGAAAAGAAVFAANPAALAAQSLPARPGNGAASSQLRGNGAGYWWRASLSTAFVWTARYAIIGCLIAAFVPMDAGTFLFIFARNITYKVILLVAITPGGAGIAEGAFPTFFGKFIGTATMTSFPGAALPHRHLLPLSGAGQHLSAPLDSAGVCAAPLPGAAVERIKEEQFLFAKKPRTSVVRGFFGFVVCGVN